MRWERSGFLNGRQLYCLRSDINGSRWRMFEEASFSSLRNAYILQWTNLRGQLKLFLRWRKKPCRLWIFLKQFRRQCPDDEKDRLTSSLCQLFTEKYWGKITDEHVKNYKPVQQHITLVFAVSLSMVEDSGEFLSAILSSHHT